MDVCITNLDKVRLEISLEELHFPRDLRSSQLCRSNFKDHTLMVSRPGTFSIGFKERSDRLGPSMSVDVTRSERDAIMQLLAAG